MTDVQRFADARELQGVEHAVARILAETDRPVEVYAAVLEAIGDLLGWELGSVWEVGADDLRLRCVRTWHAGEGAPEFEALSETMRELGSQVGQFVVRRQAEEAVHASESRLRAMLEASLDAVVTMDHRGRVLGWNHAAETIFGYTTEETVGKDMADLIVPPALRPRHRQGLARFLETEEAVVLDRRLELTGMRKDGSEFPVELTITRIALPGPPTFTGFLRDITERRRAEDELRASRARLVEVADAERRRIQRNLHDGAQQRLTAVLLTPR